MAASAQRLDDGTVVQEIGEVVAEEDAHYVVRGASGSVRARRATGCLVAPQVGDTALFAVAKSGAAWILTVLERPDDCTTTHVEVDGDLSLRSRTGAVRLQGEERVELSSRGVVAVASRMLEVHAVDARAFAEKLHLTGTAAEVGIDTLRTVASRVDQVFDRLAQRVKRSYRFVEEMDVTRAHQIDMRAEETVHVRSKNTLMASDDLVKVDAGQIHLG